MFEVHDAVSPAMQELLLLFATELETVKFPDVDGDVLASAAAEVKVRADAVARAQAALDAARLALQESQEQLVQKGARAVAYARVFAEGQPDLLQRLEAINLPRPTRRAGAREVSAEAMAPKRRGRPPKVRSNDSLFAEASAVTAELEAVS